jgi:hypothetical protein
MTERLVDLLGALHTERLTTWPPEQLQRNIDQRRINVERFDPASAPKLGVAIAPFELESVEGGVLRSQDLVKNGPAVLVFFRHESCPACNIALPYYDRNLWPSLSSLGVPLVAISPQIPEALTTSASGILSPSTWPPTPARSWGVASVSPSSRKVHPSLSRSPRAWRS